MAQTSVLRLPEFRAYLTFRGLLTFGMQMQAIVIGYHLYAITKDPLALGMIGLAEAVPAIGCALYAGHVADRSEKRGMLQLIALITAALSAGIALAHYATEPEVGWLNAKQYEWVIYTLIFAGGIARGFYSPAGSSLFGLILPRTEYSKASAWNSVVWQSGTVLGPTLGGFLYHYGNAYHHESGGILVQGVVVACLLGGTFALSFIDKRAPSKLATEQESIFESIREGWRFVLSQKLLLGAISLDMLSVFFGGAVALLPIYAQDILHVGAEGLGMLRGADAVGSVLTMLVLTRMGAFKHPWRSLLWAVAGFGCTIIGFGFSTNFYLSLAWLVALGCFDAVSVVIRSTLMQTLTPDHMRGRVASISSIFVASSNEIGSVESGVTARWFGTVPATILGGGMTLAIATGFSMLKTGSSKTKAARTEPDITAATEMEETEKSPPAAPGII